MNPYPLLKISDLIDSLGKAVIFSKCDMLWGFYIIKIAKGS
jgi:hypothetical protein